MTTTFFHYTDKVLTNVIDSDITKVTDWNMGKPTGLWLSEGTSWIDYQEHDYKFVYECKVNLDTVLSIKTLEDLYDFTKKYILDCDQWETCEWCRIDWEPIVEQYDGVYVANFLSIKNSLLEDKNTFQRCYTWFLALDCSCLVLWKPNTVITNIRLIEK